MHVCRKTNKQTQKTILAGRWMELPCGLIYSWSFMATSLSCWFDSRVGSTVKSIFLHSHLQLHFEDPFKSQSPGDPCTVTEQFDVNQQASAVCLDCFWFACDHANSLFTHIFSVFVCSFVLLAEVWVCQAFIVNWLNEHTQRWETLSPFWFWPLVTDFQIKPIMSS